MVRRLLLVEVTATVPETELDQACTVTVGPNAYAGTVKGIQTFSEAQQAAHTHGVSLSGNSGPAQ